MSMSSRHCWSGSIATFAYRSGIAVIDELDRVDAGPRSNLAALVALPSTSTRIHAHGEASSARTPCGLLVHVDVEPRQLVGLDRDLGVAGPAVAVVDELDRVDAGLEIELRGGLVVLRVHVD